MEYCGEHSDKVYTKKEIDEMKLRCEHMGVYSDVHQKEFRIYCFRAIEGM